MHGGARAWARGVGMSSGGASSSSTPSKRQRIEELLSELDSDEQQLQQLREQLGDATRRADELQAANDQAQEALLSSLPRYSRYCTTRRVELDAESAEYKYLHKRFVESVVRHKRRHAEPHRAPPQLEVHRIERCHNPRL